MVNDVRVLQVGLSFNPGGVESSVMNYYRKLRGYGVRYGFLRAYGSLAYEEEIVANGDIVHSIADPRRHPVDFSRELERIIIENGYDVVHCNMLSAANIAPLKVARHAGARKVIAHSHNTATPSVARNALHRVNRPVIPRYATDLLACSDAASSWLFPTRCRDNVIIVRNAIELERFRYSLDARRRIRSELALGDDCLVVGHTGRFEEQKNHALIVNVFAELSRLYPCSKLLLVGTGALQDEIKSRVKALGVEKDVVFAGLRSDIPEMLSAMDAFLFPSLFEGLPLSLVEAQAAGLPIIMADTITEEAAVGDDVYRLSLEAPSLQWAQTIIAAVADQQSRVASPNLIARGYDINRESQVLHDVYLG